MQVAIWQVPLEHTPVPFAGAHASPHAPQWLRLMFRFSSQPLLGFPSQSAQPAAHSPITQEPLVHVAAAFAKEHALSHCPQCVRLPLVAVSQPSALLALQSPKPGAQLVAHTLPVHVALPPLVLHALPQPPHASGSVLVFVSQPLPYCPSQFE